MQRKERIYYLDNLRAILMLLGILIHTSIFFAPQHDYFWPLINQTTNPWFRYIVLNLHVMRMPLFYILAGFFACMMKGKYHSWKIFWFRRSKRIVIPFLIAFLFLSIYHVGEFLNYTSAFHPAMNFKLVYYFFAFLGALWFLYYLIIFYVFMFCIDGCYSIIKKLWKNKFISKHLRKPFGIFFFVIPSVIIFLLNKHNILQPPLWIIPDYCNLFYYFCFFCFGWYLFRHQEQITYYKNNWFYFFMLGQFIVFPLYYYFLIHSQLFTLDLFIKAFYPISGWLISLGFLGLLQDFMYKKNSILNYFAKVSYWFYLAQVPVIMAVQMYVGLHPHEIFVEFFEIIFYSILILWLSYVLIIRYALQGLRILRILRILRY